MSMHTLTGAGDPDRLRILSLPTPQERRAEAERRAHPPQDALRAPRTDDTPDPVGE